MGQQDINNVLEHTFTKLDEIIAEKKRKGPDTGSESSCDGDYPAERDGTVHEEFDCGERALSSNVQEKSNTQITRRNTMQSIERILWPTDASESALGALEAAVVMATRFGAEIHALQIIEQVPRLAQSGFAGDPLTAFDLPLYEEHLLHMTRENLQKALAEKVPDSIKSTRTVEIGSPKESILEYSRDNDIDLIVMATQGRGGLTHLLLGSVAESTVRQSPVPVLVIPPAGDADSD